VRRAEFRKPCSNFLTRSELTPQRSASCCRVNPAWLRSCARCTPIASSGVPTVSWETSPPRAEWAHAEHTVCRLYRLSGTPQPAHNRGTTAPGERVTVVAGAGMSRCLRVLGDCWTAPQPRRRGRSPSTGVRECSGLPHRPVVGGATFGAGVPDQQSSEDHQVCITVCGRSPHQQPPAVTLVVAGGKPDVWRCEGHGP
jgi:hypothetical protein